MSRSSRHGRIIRKADSQHESEHAGLEKGGVIWGMFVFGNLVVGQAKNWAAVSEAPS